MRVITGYITLAGFLLLVGKFASRMIGNKKLDAWFMKTHKWASAMIFLGGILHLILVLVAWKGMKGSLLLSGGISFVIANLIIMLGHTTKNRKKMLVWHRILSTVLLLTISGHMILYFV